MRDVSYMLADGLEEAFIGYIHRFNTPIYPVYDKDKALELLCENGMEPEDAEEYFNYNILGAWVGDGTPGFLQRCSLDEYNELISTS